MRPLLSLSLIWISRATTSPLPLPPLSPHGALGIGDGDHRILDPEVSSPPLLLSLSLSLLFFLPRVRPSFFSSLLARAPALPRSPAARPAPPLPPARGGTPRPCPAPRRRFPPPLLGPRGGARPPLPGPAAALARPCPSRGGDPVRPCSLARGLRRGLRPRRGPRRLGPGTAPAPARPRPPARVVLALGVASRSPFAASAFPRAQPALAAIIFGW
jgi:hypothetical protein